MGYQAALIALSTIAILVLIPPFIWHAKTINVPAIALIIWLLSMDIKIFVDAIIWGRDDFETRYDGRGYCDVMVKLEVGANVGISCSVAGIMFNLYRILKADKVIPGLTSFKKICTDLLISLLTPIFVMGVNYLVQSRRYFIFQYSGCQSVLTLSWVTVVLYTMWMVIWSFVGVVYAIMILIRFFRKRKDVRDILRCTNSGLNLVKFSKLLIFCIIVILIMFPFSLYMFSSDLGNVSPDYDFETTHSKVFWNAILYMPFKKPYFVTWVYLSLSYIVFIFFGLGSETIDMYLQILSKIGFKPLITHVRQKRQERKIKKADKLVSKAIHGGTLGTASESGTAFDIEMQRIIKEDEEEDYDDKSPTSTTVSNVFSDKNAINKKFNNFEYLSGFNESMLEGLDEDDLNYINMLYEHDSGENNSNALDDLSDAKQKVQIEVSTPISPKDSMASTTKEGEGEFDFVYKIQHRQ